MKNHEYGKPHGRLNGAEMMMMITGLRKWDNRERGGGGGGGIK